MTTTPETTAEAAPTPEEMNQLALRVAVTGIQEDDARARHQGARAAAAPRFALARKLGVKQQAVILPGNVEAGVLALKQGRTTVDVHEDELLLLVTLSRPAEVEDYAVGDALIEPRAAGLLAEHCPDLVETRIRDGALSDPRAVKVLAEYAPDLVERRIKPAFRAELMEEIERRDGYVTDPASGELALVADVTHHDPAGDFAYTGKTRFAGKVREALESGRLKVTETGDVIEVPAGGEHS